jgi:PAS domain S-box-containing protein
MTSALSQHTILIIDDSPEDRETYRRYLTRESEQSYQIVEVEEGSSVSVLCEQFQPDAVLLDYCLPDQNGLQVLEQIKQYQAALPVIMLTGQGDETIAVQAIKQGAEDYLVKGQTSANKLRLVVQNAIKNAQLRQQLQQSESRRQESQQFIQEIANTTPGIIYVYDLIEQRNVFVNPQITTLLGYSPAQIQAMGGELFARLFHPEDLAQVPAHLERFHRTQAGETLSMEYRMQHANGEWRWFSDRGVVFRRTEEGHLWQILGIAQDITDLKRVQEELQNQLERDRLVTTITQHMRQSLNLEEVLQTTVDLIRQFLQTDRVLIFKLESRDTGSIVTESVREGWMPLLSTSITDPCFNADYVGPYHQGQIMVIPDLEQADLAPCYIDLLSRLQVRANLVMPIVQGNQLWGLLTAQQCAATRQWHLSEIQLLQSLAAQASIAIQQAELYQQAQTEILQRQQAELELQAAKERYELAANAVNCLIYDWDVNMQTVKRSQGLIPLIGYTPTEAGTDLNWWSDRIHPDDLPRVTADCETSMAQQDRFAVEYRVRHRQGHYIWVLDHAVALRDAEGRLVRVVGSTRDISDRKLSEENLRRSLQEIYDLYNQAPCGYHSLDLDGVITLVNETELQMLGYTRAEVLGKPMVDLLTPDSQQIFQDHFPSFRQQNHSQELELQMVCKDGSTLPVSARTTAIQDAAGNLLTHRMTLIDIHQRKQAEELLREREERLSLALDAARMGSWDWNLLTHEVKWSPYHAIIFGYEPTSEQHTFTDWLARVYPEDLPRIEACMDAARLNHQQYHCEYRILWPDGSLHWVDAYGRFYYNPQGEPIRMIGVISDITERKTADAALEAARAEAEAANQAKDDFIAVVSHELRSPLNSMLGWTKLIKMGKIDAETLPQALEAIERGAQAQVQLVDDLLDISRIIRGKLNLIFTPFKVASVLEIAIHLAGPTAEAKQIRLEQQIDASATFLVSGDSQRIQQVVGNLLTNAIKFTPPGGQITVGLQQIEPVPEGQGADASLQSVSPYPHSNLPALSYAKITVTDTGKGISAELLPHIFDRFRQDKRIAGKTKDGLGLGLAIVQQLVEMHQGKVFADSPGEGLGSTFTILLPLIHQSTEVDATPPPSLQPLLECNGLRILVVDDESDIVNYLKFTLESQGAIVAAETTASKGFEQVLSFKPNLIISDIGMPEEDGYAFLQRIRGLTEADGGQTPAIALTAFAQPDTREKVLAAGFQLYLKKPIDPEYLVDAIVNLLRKCS